MESSLIVSGISPEYGKIDFLIKGERRISKKKSPEIDLFRIFNVEYAEKNSNIFNPLVMEYVRGFDRLAYYPDKLVKLLTITGFLLRNIHYAVSCKSVYSALTNHLERVIQGIASPVMYIKLAYLHENGLLSDSLSFSTSEEERRGRRVIALLLRHIIGERIPDFDIPDEYMNKLEEWVDSLCLANHIL